MGVSKVCQAFMSPLQPVLSLLPPLRCFIPLQAFVSPPPPAASIHCACIPRDIDRSRRPPHTPVPYEQQGPTWGLPPRRHKDTPPGYPTLLRSGAMIHMVPASLRKPAQTRPQACFPTAHARLPCPPPHVQSPAGSPLAGTSSPWGAQIRPEDVHRGSSSIVMRTSSSRLLEWVPVAPHCARAI